MYPSTIFRPATAFSASVDNGKQWRNLGTAIALSLVVSGCSKPAPAPATPTPAPTPIATPTATPAPTPVVELPKYSGAQQMEYVQTASSAFIELRGAKITPYLEARKAFNDAGGISGKGLTSKEAIAQQRQLVDKVRQANDDYLTFVSTQPEAYRAELAKTPLSKDDIDSIVAEYVVKSKQPEVTKLREVEGERIKTSDEMLGYLDKKFGAWTFNNGKLNFKKPADGNGYGDLIKKYNGLVAQTAQMQTEVNAAATTADQTTGPGVSPAAGSGAGSPVIAPTVAPKP